MATKKNETKTTAAQQNQENQVTQIEEQNQNAENQSAENVQSEQAQNQNEQAQTEDTQNTQNQSEPQKENEMQKKELIAFHELAAKYRLPSWQSAAILKLLDKEDDAHLTENEFTAALEKLYNRKMGA